MKLSTYAVISAIVTLVYGFALLFFPVEFVRTYGSDLDAVGTVLARLYGSAMFSFGIVYWLNRNVPEQ
ncbi:hypothetical protein [Pollutibacter soli]|uniref:hypothetical protein n=1 Tax=Pollutibacter soli TaxID=3034157 RepID=UPI00301327E9